ncbi:MAG: hypothetical protein V9H69_19935 [Anaerolineae bacterium]
MAGITAPSPADANETSPAQPRLAYRGAAWLFGLALLVSLVLLIVSLIALVGSGGRLPMEADEDGSSLALIISTATSAVSLIGLLSTNLMAWRREARDAREAELDLQRQRLELEKLRLELEKQKSNP